MRVEVTEAPIFVLGAPRSGTSMMQWALRQHPDLWGGPESDFLIPLIRSLREVHRFGSERGDLHWLSGEGVDSDEFMRSVGIGINALYTQRSGGLRWVEQTPQYTLALDDLSSMFPGSLYVMMLRDGRDVVTSLRHFVNPKTHEEACRLWVKFTEAELAFHETTKGERSVIVRYTDVVADPESELGRVFEFLGLEYDSAAADFIRNQRINSSFGSGEKKPTWRDWTSEERSAFLDIAGGAFGRAGFELGTEWPGT